MEQPNNLIKSFPSSFTTHNPLLSFLYIDYFIATFRRVIRIVQSIKTNWNVVLFEKKVRTRMSRAVVVEEKLGKLFLFSNHDFALILPLSLSLNFLSENIFPSAFLAVDSVVAWGSWTQHNKKEEMVFHFSLSLNRKNENIVCRHAWNIRSLPLSSS